MHGGHRDHRDHIVTSSWSYRERLKFKILDMQCISHVVTWNIDCMTPAQQDTDPLGHGAVCLAVCLAMAMLIIRLDELFLELCV